MRCPPMVFFSNGRTEFRSLGDAKEALETYLDDIKYKKASKKDKRIRKIVMEAEYR